MLTCDLSKIDEWQAGDIVVFADSHIGILSDVRNHEGIPFLLHNGGLPKTKEDCLRREQLLKESADITAFNIRKRLKSCSVSGKEHEMKACITGASSGIGRDMARVLADYGIDLFIVARRSERLKQLQDELSQKVKVTAITLDLAEESSCRLLYERLQKEDIDILINNAGFGMAGPFTESDLQRELTMIDTNIKACHILTKLFCVIL